MPFSNRNSYYLRISPYSVLPLFLYLDERHTSWMSDTILQLVLEDLRGSIGPKLRAESALVISGGAKKPTVDVHRGTSYQFAYFLRKADPHTVLVKQRNFTLQLREPKPSANARPSIAESPLSRTTPKDKKSSRQKPTLPQNSATGRKGKRTTTMALENDDEDVSGEEEVQVIESGDAQLRRSGRVRQILTGGYAEDDETDDQVMDDSEFMPGPASSGSIDVEHTPSADPLFRPSTPPRSERRPAVKSESVGPPQESGSAIFGASTDVIDFSMDPDNDEDKPKPHLELTYTGFSIYGCSLCVIVEPYPPLRHSVIPAPQPKQTSLPPLWRSSRVPSVPPENGGGTAGEKGTTPIFRPETPLEDDSFSTGDRQRTPLFRLDTPEPERRGASMGLSAMRSPSPFPGFTRDSSILEDEDMDGDGSMLMEFSQVLSSTGAGRLGGMSRDDAEDEGGEGFFGDADEARENS